MTMFRLTNMKYLMTNISCQTFDKNSDGIVSETEMTTRAELAFKVPMKTIGMTNITSCLSFTSCACTDYLLFWIDNHRKIVYDCDCDIDLIWQTPCFAVRHLTRIIVATSLKRRWGQFIVIIICLYAFHKNNDLHDDYQIFEQYQCVIEGSHFKLRLMIVVYVAANLECQLV